MIEDGVKIISVTSIVEDITEKIINKENPHHSQIMDTIRKLAGGLAYDCNNVSGGIIVNSDLRNKCADAHDKKIARCGVIVLSSTDKIKISRLNF